MERKLAIIPTIILGTNHALIAISRMLSRNNTSLLVELIALSILFRAMVKRSALLMYLGGLFAGISFYCYTPARTVFFIFLLAYFFTTWSRKNWRQFLALLCPAILGFVISIMPMLWASYTAPRRVFSVPA